MGMFARARNAAINRIRKPGIPLSDIGSVGATPIPAAGLAAARRKSRSFGKPAPMPDANQRRMMGKRAGMMDQSKYAGRPPGFKMSYGSTPIPEEGKRAAMMARRKRGGGYE